MTDDRATSADSVGAGRRPQLWRRLRAWWRGRTMPTIGVEDAYTLWAADYGRPPNCFQRLEHESMVRLLPPLHRRSVLDVGCGTGRIVRESLARGAEHAVGVDSTLPMIWRAVSEPAAGAGWAGGAVQELPFAAASFDLVTCGLVLGHVADLQIALDELSRVLRPGGALLISDFHPRASRRGWRRTVTDPTTGKEHAIEHHVHDLTEYHRGLERQRLTIEAVEEPRWEGQPVVFVLRARLAGAGR